MAAHTYMYTVLANIEEFTISAHWNEVSKMLFVWKIE